MTFKDQWELKENSVKGEMPSKYKKIEELDFHSGLSEKQVVFCIFGKTKNLALKSEDGKHLIY